MVPFVRRTSGGGFELFFSSRDEQGRSTTGRAALNLSECGSATVDRPAPVLCPGALGAFDDSGAMGSCLVSHGGYEYLYYIGWTLGRTVPFATYVGLALSDDGGRTFERVSQGPIIGRSRTDPFLATSPWVLVEHGLWRMWYTSGVRWEPTVSGPRHYYRITYAESYDGIEWHPTGRICVDFADDSEYAIARPCVVRDGSGYRMWFSCRGPTYRIGYAVSADGLVWARDDSYGGLDSAGHGWESRSVEYGVVFEEDETRWMLYNGNDYGETGIGLAKWEGDA